MGVRWPCLLESWLQIDVQRLRVPVEVVLNREWTP
jgi:hypothetical protein